MNAKWHGAILFTIGSAVIAIGAASAQTAAERPAMGPTIAPHNAEPERDSRGVKVISDPATTPRGANEPLGSQSGASRDPRVVFATQASDEEYPVCSKTVTDNCVQVWEPPRRLPTCPGDPECPPA